MAIASLVLGISAWTSFLWSSFLSRELQSIIHMSQIDQEKFLIPIILGVSITGLILGIRAIRSRQRKTMGIVGTVLNAIALPYAIGLTLLMLFL